MVSSFVAYIDESGDEGFTFLNSFSGGNGSADAANESTEDVELRHQLLAPLIERSAVGHWLKRGALDRVILKKLVDDYST